MRPPELEQLVIDTWDFDDPATTETSFGRLLADAQPASSMAAVLLTQVARARGLRGDFAGAHEALDAAADAAAEIAEGPERDHVEARLAIERGRAVNSAGNPADALRYFEAAFALATGAGTDGLAVDALHMQAIATSMTGTAGGAAVINQRALELALGSDDPAARRWRASLLNNLGWDLHTAGDFAGALDAFEQALAARLEDGATSSQVTVARWAVAHALRSLGQLDEALEIQRGLAADEANADDGYIPEEIGECLLELGRVEEAKVWFAKAHAILSRDSWLVEHEPERLARLAEYTDAEYTDADPTPSA